MIYSKSEHQRLLSIAPERRTRPQQDRLLALTKEAKRLSNAKAMLRVSRAEPSPTALRLPGTVAPARQRKAVN